MIILGLAAEHNSSACLMVNGKIKGLIQEERLTKVKNQVAFPLKSIDRLIENFLDDRKDKIDVVVYGTLLSNPYYTCLDMYSHFEVEDHLRQMRELWYPHFYEGKKNNGDYWRKKFLDKKELNFNHNYDFSFLKNETSLKKAIDIFSTKEKYDVIKRNLPYIKNIERVDHHTCHAYYAAYGAPMDKNKLQDSLILTADAWGDEQNWTANVLNKNGTLKKISGGAENTLARIYKFCTLILGMKPNEHEYKVMGLSGYSKSRKHIEHTENIFFEILDFRNGQFTSTNPLIDSYYDLKKRLEGHRFDNIAAALQNWTSIITNKWVTYWLKETNKKGLCFSGGLSMNIKANGDLKENSLINWLSVPPSGGDESLSAGACLALSAGKIKIFPIKTPYLGEKPQNKNNNIYNRLTKTGMQKNDFVILNNFTLSKAAILLSKNHILARCMGNSEFGARALGNRSILANPSNIENIKKINESIKNRDFWMPFTPSIMEEYTNKYLINPKNIKSPYMTIGYNSTTRAKEDIIACLHPGDYSARPQFVSKDLNKDYWLLIEEFRKITGIPCLLNTSLNLHGEPMNYSLEDAIRTLALSSLNFLLMPGNQLLCKKSAEKLLDEIFNDENEKI